MIEAASSSETSLYLCHVVTLYTPEHTQSSNEIPYVLKDALYNTRQFVNSCVISTVGYLGLPTPYFFGACTVGSSVFETVPSEG